MKIKDRAKPKLPQIEPGVYMAVCVYSLDIGEQLCEYKDKGKSYNNQVQLVFELVGETVEIDGKQEPRTISRTFNMAMGKNGALRKFVQSWFGKQISDQEFSEFDPNSLVGLATQLSVMLNESGEYSNIDGVMQLPKGVEQPKATLPKICFDLEPWDEALFMSLPEWVQDKIKKSTQYQTLHAPTDKIQFADETTAPPTTKPAPAEAESGCPI